MGFVCKKLTKYERAVEEFLRAVYLNPNTVSPIKTSEWYTILKKIFLAYSRLPENHKDRSLKTGGINNLAAVFKKLGQLEKTEVILKLALKLGASHAGTHYNM
jgi:hypothetical protein